MSLVTCDRCFLPDVQKIHEMFFQYDSTRKLAVFLLNVILNIQNFHKEYCTCQENVICNPYTSATVFSGEQYSLFKNCLDFEYLYKIRAKLHGSMMFLLEKKTHFVCTIIGHSFYFEHRCFFTGDNVSISLELAYEEWEKARITEIATNKSPRVLVFRHVASKNSPVADTVLV